MIIGLQNADAGSMSFVHVDMSRYVFYGSHDLGSMAIEPTAKRSRTPWGTEDAAVSQTSLRTDYMLVAFTLGGGTFPAHASLATTAKKMMATQTQSTCPRCRPHR